MTEQLQNITLNTEQLATATKRGDRTLKTADALYGIGFPHFESSVEASLGYRNVE